MLFFALAIKAEDPEPAEGTTATVSLIIRMGLQSGMGRLREDVAVFLDLSWLQ